MEICSGEVMLFNYVIDAEIFGHEAGLTHLKQWPTDQPPSTKVVKYGWSEFIVMLWDVLMFRGEWFATAISK
jgi:hypothetical protein